MLRRKTMKKIPVNYRQYLPQLSLKERNRRWAAVWEEMALNDIDCLLVIGNDRFFGYGNANVRYLTQIDGQRMGTAVIFPLEGTPVVFGTPPHMHDKPFPVYKAFNDWVPETRSMSGYKAVVDSLKDMGYGKGNIGLVSFKGSFKSGTISYQEYQSVVSQLPEARFVDATALLDRVRLIKSMEEIGMLKKSGEIARAKVETMIKMAKPGVKECELFAEMVKTEISLGGEAFVFNLLASGSVTDTGYIQHLLHGRAQTLAPTTRPLRKGDLIITEFHTSYAGYLTGCEKSVFIGKPPKELRRIHDVAAECLEKGIEKLRPGVTFGEALEAFRKPAKIAKMDYVELGFHGHGMASPEFPTMVYAEKKSDKGTGSGPFSEEVGFYGLASIEIRENMVLSTNIDIHDPLWRDDVGIMGPGETVWVSGKGPVRLIGTPVEFAVVGA
jgi:Xaa-Pro aminopeptidase